MASAIGAQLIKKLKFAPLAVSWLFDLEEIKTLTWNWLELLWVHSWVLPSPPGSKCVPCHLLPSLGTLPSPEQRVAQFYEWGRTQLRFQPGHCHLQFNPSGKRILALSKQDKGHRCEDTFSQPIFRSWQGRWHFGEKCSALERQGWQSHSLSLAEVPVFDLLLYFLREIAPCRAVCFRLHSTYSWS